MQSRKFRAGVKVAKLLRTFFNPLLKPIYRLYEVWLWAQISEGPIPKHVAVIPDGNRRWAKYLGKNPLYGHEVGYRKLKEVLNWLWEVGVKAVTIYAMSYENCVGRPEEERKHLFTLLSSAIDELMEGDEIRKRRMRVKFLGRLDMVPEGLVKKMEEVERESSGFKDRYLNVAVCYGGRQEIVNAVKKLLEDVRKGNIGVDEVNEDVFRKYLQTSHLNLDGVDDPDLVIRTSGELRVSNFLLWQIAYSELYFCEAYWPEFRKIDLWRAIRSYQKRERRFGK
ncbi:MAG: di-trans,poly-cis-decaprenylcistransferase [Desulfurococcales archaeon]|nr:di-trans,poly-cis-decaprenylcistransferase [Desulfurococcales archaeon]